MITATDNKLIKRVVAIKNGKAKEDVFLAEGLRFVSEIPDTFETELFIISESFAATAEGGVFAKKPNCYVTSNKVFKKCSDTQNPQGVLAVCKKPKYNLDKINKDGVFVILQGLSDPGNMGTIIRTADAVNARAVMVTKGSADVYNPKVLRSTMGSIFRTPIIDKLEIEQIRRFTKENAIPVYGMSIKAKKSLYALNLKSPFAFIIGNEARGMDAEAEKICSELIKIPIVGKAESLNASVAASVVMYEALRQKEAVFGV